MSKVRYKKKVGNYCRQLKLSKETYYKVIEVIREIEENEKFDLNKKTLSRYIAASIYISSILQSERRSQKRISEVVEVSILSLRDKYKELIENLDVDVIL